LAETLGAFESLAADGKILAYGVSNFDVDELNEAAAIAGAERIACNQVLYHLGERSIEYEVVPACRRHGIAVVAYSPFGSGRFPAPSSAGGKVLAEIGAARGLSAHQIALAFLIQQGGVFAIPKAAETPHTLENAAAGDVELTAAEMRAIDAAFAGKRRRGLPTL
jgi:diketogulonate reductase-like aldo/keto reductase